MRNPKVNYFAVGSFVLLMLVGLIFSMALLTGRTSDTTTYYAVYDNVADVKFGTQVLYEGYPIGQVEQVTPFSEGARVRFKTELSVLEDWHIPDDSSAQIVSSGLLAPVTINIQAGKSTEFYQSGGTLISRNATDMFAVMSSVASRVMDLSEEGIKPLLENMNNTVTGFSGLLEKDVSGLMKELTALVQGLNRDAPAITRNLDGFAENMNAGSQQLRQMIDAADPEQVRVTMNNIVATAENFASLSGDLKASREQLDLVLSNSNQLIDDNKSNVKGSLERLYHVLDSLASHIDSMNYNLDRTARNMKEFSARIRQNPSLLISADSPKDEASQ
ncbi:MAG: MCE family protein [Gammaproteobacteria bacterium]|nr:MCE family protein [Gammaproteobacteria bacterium]